MSQNFSKGKIYKITNDFNDEVYIGSTCDTLTKRFSNQRNNINTPSKMDRPLYILMREIGVDRFRIEIIEEFPCGDKYQLRQREGFHIREQGTLNKRIESRTAKERYDENKIDILLKAKDYRLKHIEEYKERDKLYNKNHKNEIQSRNKIYYEINKENVKQHAKEYRKEIIKCECGCDIKKGSLNYHKKSIKHQNLLNQQLTIQSL